MAPLWILCIVVISTSLIDDSSPRTSERYHPEGTSDIIEIDEWLVPWEGRPRDPYVAPDGNVFFVGQRTHYVGHFNVETKEFSRFDLEDGAGPHTVIVAPDGTPWYAGNRANHIGKLDPATGDIRKYMMPDDMSARDPHTMAFNDEGNIWFTAQGANSVGLFDVTTGESTILPVPTERARPYGIVMDVDMRRPWIVLFGTNKLATVDPETMDISEIELPRSEARPRRLAVTSDGTVWYCDYAAGYIGSYNPRDGSIKEWKMPQGSNARPYAMASDHHDRLWVVASGIVPNEFTGFDPATETFFVRKPIESGGGTVRHMVYHEDTRSFWFGADTNYLGRATLFE
jgi:virginiamycin B lyase